MNKCMICGKELEKEDTVEKVCTTNCGVDIITICKACYNSEYGDKK